MRIGRRGLLEHLRLLGPLFALIGAVWALRMILAAAGAPGWLLGIVAVTVAGPVCVLLAAFLIHFRGFGSYVNVVLASLLLSAWGQLLIIAATFILSELHFMKCSPVVFRSGPKTRWKSSTVISRKIRILLQW